MGVVLLGNDQICKIKGMANIALKPADGSLKVLSEVRYIPTLKKKSNISWHIREEGTQFPFEGWSLKNMQRRESDNERDQKAKPILS